MKLTKFTLLFALLPFAAHAQPYPYAQTDTLGYEDDEGVDAPATAPRTTILPPAQTQQAPAVAPPVDAAPAPQLPMNLQSRILMDMQMEGNGGMGMQSVQVKSDDPELEPDPEPVAPDLNDLPAAAVPAQRPAGATNNSRPADAPVFRGTLRDFKTVHFSCVSDTKGDYLSSNICSMAEMRARELARDVRLTLKPASGREDNDGFTLSVKLQSNGVKVPRAITVRVEASRMYEGAVDARTSYAYPGSGPRKGRLVFWDTTITAVSASYNGQLDDSVRQYLRGMLKRFFTYYKAQ